MHPDTSRPRPAPAYQLTPSGDGMDDAKSPAGRRLLKNITWIGAGNLLVKPIWFVFVTAVCVRLLGISEYGVMVASLALAGIVGSLLDLGISQYSIREVARDRSSGDRFFSNLVVLRAGTGVAGLAIALFCGHLLGYDGSRLVALAFAAGYWLTQQITEYCRTFYRAFERFDFEAYSVLVEKVIVISAGTALLLVEHSAAWVLAGMFLGMAIVGLGNGLWVSQRIARFRPSLISMRFLRQVVPRALPLGMVGIFVVIYFRTDSVMLEAMVGEAVAGQYGLAYRILEALILLPGVIVAVLLPRLSVYFANSSDRGFSRLVRVAGVFLLGMGVLLAASIAYGATNIIALLDSDPASAAAAGALQILAWTFPIAALNYLFSTALTAADDEKILAWILAGAAALNIALNFVLIPHYSLNGAAAATLVTELSIAISLAFRFKNRERVRDMQEVNFRVK